MIKKATLAAALGTFDRTPAASARVSTTPKETPKHASAQAPSRRGKKALIAHVAPEVSKQVKQIALDTDRSAQAVVSEALNDLFQKYRKPTIG